MKVYRLIEILEQLELGDNIILTIEINDTVPYLIDGDLVCVRQDEKNIHLLSLYQGNSLRVKLIRELEQLEFELHLANVKYLS